jgi:hypothetical protein
MGFFGGNAEYQVRFPPFERVLETIRRGGKVPLHFSGPENFQRDCEISVQEIERRRKYKIKAEYDSFTGEHEFNSKSVEVNMHDSFTITMTKEN